MGKNEILAILSSYKSKYAQKYGIQTLGVFGSVARDQGREDSDLDICVTTATPNPFVLAHIKDDLEQIVHCRVDIVRVRENMNPYLKERIKREGIYV
jgi:hypothetical protein